jgi:hypothetical protein
MTNEQRESWNATRPTGSRTSTPVESWGLGVLDAEDEDELRTFAAGDPAVTIVFR